MIFPSIFPGFPMVSPWFSMVFPDFWVGKTSQALEALKVAWPLGGAEDAALQQRLERSCRGLEMFTFEAVNTAPVEPWKNGGG